MPTPTSPTTPPPKPKPIKPTSTPSSQPLSKEDQKYAYLLKSPFAKMFEKSGAAPTVKEMQMIMNGILKQELDAIKKQDAQWKKAMRKLKKVLEGND